MKLLATVKRTPDRNSRMRLTPAGGIVTDGVTFEMNAFDELAVEEALQIRDRVGGEVVVLAVGPAAAGEALQSALAMGADRALRVDATDGLEPLVVAQALAAAIAREAPDLVLMGKLAIDAENGQIPLMVAELLAWPHASFASKIELDGAKTARVTCEVDGGLEVVEVELPAVITTDLRLNQPRYASLPGILKAKKKPSVVVPLAELVPEPATGDYRVAAYRPLPARQRGETLDSPEALAAKLIERGLV